MRQGSLDINPIVNGGRDGVWPTAAHQGVGVCRLNIAVAEVIGEAIGKGPLGVGHTVWAEVLPTGYQSDHGVLDKVLGCLDIARRQGNRRSVKVASQGDQFIVERGRRRVPPAGARCGPLPARSRVAHTYLYVRGYKAFGTDFLRRWADGAVKFSSLGARVERTFATSVVAPPDTVLAVGRTGSSYGHVACWPGINSWLASIEATVSRPASIVSRRSSVTSPCLARPRPAPRQSARG